MNFAETPSPFGRVLERRLSRTREQLLFFRFAVVRSAEERKSEWLRTWTLTPTLFQKEREIRRLNHDKEAVTN
jgi:hypothetical protein